MLFAVIRKGGPGWDPARPLREQDKWDEHAEYMDALGEEGAVVFAGPLGDGHPEHRVLQICEADSEDAINTQLEEDPWTPMGMLTTVSIERWNVLIGELTGR
jgi:uncharacterized protein YciI